MKLDPEYQSLFLDNSNVTKANSMDIQSKNHHDKVSFSICVQQCIMSEGFFNIILYVFFFLNFISNIDTHEITYSFYVFLYNKCI